MFNDQLKEYVIGRACSLHRKDKKYIKILDREYEG
jgi:hypothetical protein